MTCPSPASMPSRASAQPLQRHGHLRSVTTPIVRRGQDGMNGDVIQRRFDDIGHFAHVPEQRCTGAPEVVAGPISRLARLLDCFGLAVPIEQPCPCQCGENQSIGGRVHGNSVIANRETGPQKFHPKSGS